MGFDCFLDSANKNTKLALVASISDSLVNDQILREISRKLNESVHLPIKRVATNLSFFQYMKICL